MIVPVKSHREVHHAAPCCCMLNKEMLPIKTADVLYSLFTKQLECLSPHKNTKRSTGEDIIRKYSLSTRDYLGSVYICLDIESECMVMSY